MKKFLSEAASVRPSERQKKWFDLGMYAFIHFGVNTFTDREWGLGNEDEAVFNPTKLNPDQWTAAIKDAGFKGIVLTCKHHDGFCLWPSKYTEHSVKNSPVKTDVVKAVSDACKRADLKFGVYLSPWDRNSCLYGTDAYNDYFVNQLTELLTGYGDIFYIFLDGACGEGPNGKVQKYDFPRIIETVRKYQPEAVIFYDKGSDVRWVGNEAGRPRYSEWAVVPKELCPYAEVQTGEGPLAEDGNLDFIYNTDSEIGSLSGNLYSKGLVFCPSEMDTSIRKGWFWHEEQEPKSVRDLFNIYLSSVGANACLHLNIPPTREGLLDERDVKRLHEFGEMIRREFSKEAGAKAERTGGSDMQAEFTLTFDTEKDIKYVVLEEDLDFGQRIESFSIYSASDERMQYQSYQGTTVGNRKICPLYDPFADQNPLIARGRGKIKKLIIKIKAARADVRLKSIRAYEACPEKEKV
ncbi:MAG: alpha-L-fucosidase [Clostridia bacterium]|nr:alpha-L-fucosidase [Clostridia bacterium]